MNTQSMGHAVIAGASTGIGAIYADRLARRGYDLLLVARSRERMDDLAKKLAAETGGKIEILTADFMDSNDLARQSAAPEQSSTSPRSWRLLLSV